MGCHPGSLQSAIAGRQVRAHAGEGCRVQEGVRDCEFDRTFRSSYILIFEANVFFWECRFSSTKTPAL